MTIFCWKFFVWQYRKTPQGEPFCVWKKNLVLKTFIHKRGAVLRFSVVTIQLKNVGKGWDSNPYLLLQNPVVLPTVRWEPSEFLTMSVIIKIFCTRDSNPDLSLQNPVVLTPLLSFILEQEELAILDWKKEKRPYWIIFLAYYICGEK